MEVISGPNAECNEDYHAARILVAWLGEIPTSKSLDLLRVVVSSKWKNGSLLQSLILEIVVMYNSK